MLFRQNAPSRRDSIAVAVLLSVNDRSSNLIELHSHRTVEKNALQTHKTSFAIYKEQQFLHSIKSLNPHADDPRE